MRMCPVCGKREIGPRAEMCDPCKRKRNREYYFRIGICPTCKRNKLFGSERMCIECRAKYSERAIQRYHANKELMKIREHERYVRRYAKLKESCLCIKCGHRKAEEGYARCRICRIKRQMKDRNDIPRSERVANGLCYFCGSELDRVGRSCTKCAARCTKALEGNRPKRNEEWRRKNSLIFVKKVE